MRGHMASLARLLGPPTIRLGSKTTLHGVKRELLHYKRLLQIQMKKAKRQTLVQQFIKRISTTTAITCYGQEQGSQTPPPVQAEVEFINNPQSRLIADLDSTTNQVDSKAWVFAVFMNNCLESTLKWFIDYFIETNPLVFSGRVEHPSHTFLYSL